MQFKNERFFRMKGTIGARATAPLFLVNYRQVGAKGQIKAEFTQFGFQARQFLLVHGISPSVDLRPYFLTTKNYWLLLVLRPSQITPTMPTKSSTPANSKGKR